MDDTTAGWIYQYWNDPDREAINERVKDKGKVAGKEIASATQLFTERYMVEWLLQNSLGNLWLAICKKNGWDTTAVKRIEELRVKREEHNLKIERKIISEDTPLPIGEDEEEHWKYYLERELTKDEVESAIVSIKEAKLLDPACGSGHFLLYAFTLLFYLYEEEDRIKANLDKAHKPLTKSEIAKSILENNLHGIDLDPRAVQIAVASLYTTAKKHGKLQLSRLNLVATRPSIGANTSPKTLDAFIEQFCTESKIPTEMAKSLISVLGKSDVLGSLLQIRTEIKTELDKQGLFARESESSIYTKLEEFVNNHDQGNDLGLFTLGTQLTRGLRLLRLLDAKYDVVVANPPYLSEAKVHEEANSIFINGASELYESFIYCFKNRLKKGGFFALLTAHNFLFIEKFSKLRLFILENYTLDTVAQLGVWTFKDISQPGALGFVCFILRNESNQKESMFFRIGSGNFRQDPYYKEPYLLNQPPKRIYHFDQRKFAAIEGSPMIYWWTESFRNWYLGADKVGDMGETRQGIATCNNERFLRNTYEVKLFDISIIEINNKIKNNMQYKYQAYVKGNSGNRWLDSILNIIKYNDKHECDIYRNLVINTTQTPDRSIFFKQGIVLNNISSSGLFSRIMKYKSIFGNAVTSFFASNPEETQVALSSVVTVYVSQSLNPTINNTVGDVKNLPIVKVSNWQDYIERARVLYDEEFSLDETNVEYLYE